ncbi:hypothetical protein GCM10010195_16030 [Kitasatospora griseola]|nr:hypothetical protein GCM10010195_16030 [Kitasatospora griseola]
MAARGIVPGEAVAGLSGEVLLVEPEAVAAPVAGEQVGADGVGVAPGAVELLGGEQDGLQAEGEDRFPDGGGHAGGVRGAVVVEGDDAVLGECVAGHPDVARDVLVQVRGVDVDEPAAVGGDPAVGEHRGGGLDDHRQFGVEGQVVDLEGAPGEGGAVGHGHLGGVVAVGRVRVEEVADGERLPGVQVVAQQDRRAAQVGAHLQQVSGDAGGGLPGEQPAEDLPVDAEEPAGDVVGGGGGGRSGGGVGDGHTVSRGRRPGGGRAGGTVGRGVRPH